MRAQLVVALRAILVLTIVCGLAYPLVATGAAQLAFGDRANGSLIEQDGTIVGSELLRQEFLGDEYFHPRPSAAGAAASGSFGEDGEPVDTSDLSLVASSASNLGPANEELLAAVAERAVDYRQFNGLDRSDPVPVDAVTSSGSGLDPHISVANATIQAPRVAEARGVPVDDVLTLVAEHTTGRSLGFLGEPGVNVLTLNLALDEITVR